MDKMAFIQHWGVKDLCNDVSGEILGRTSNAPKQLLKCALKKIEENQAQYSDDVSDEYQKGMRLENSVCDALRRCMNPPSVAIIDVNTLVHLTQNNMKILLKKVSWRNRR